MRKKALILTLCAACLLATLVACGATAEPAMLVEEGVRTVAEAVEVEREVVAAEATMAPAPAAEAPAAGSSGLAAPVAPRVDRMIIKDAELELLVADTDDALDSVTLIASDYGGYIVSSHTWVEGEFRYATLRMGVPAAEFENVLRRLRGLALEVTSEIASGEDVTDQYVDLQSRLTNLEATRDRIREFLDKAENVEEALQVNEQLSQVEAQIEEIQGRMNYLRDRAAYSTITVQLVPERPTPTPTPTATPTPTPTPVAWRPGETFTAATDVLTTMLKGLVDLGIWALIILGPFVLPVAFVLWLVLRRRRPKSPPPPPRPDTSVSGSEPGS
ncbi:MAG: DUF4349 domain-containing protein [Anaerolineae bacterium]|jgi:hypothetical protein